MRDLSFRGPPQLAVAENATTPTGVLGAVIWSTTAGKKLEWDGSKWAGPGSGAPGSGDVVGPASSVNRAIPVFDGATGKVLAESNLVVNEYGALGVILTPGQPPYFGWGGQILMNTGPTTPPTWVAHFEPALQTADTTEGVAFSGNLLVTTQGEVYALSAGWFPAIGQRRLPLPSGSWYAVSRPDSYNSDLVFFFSYTGDILRIARFDLADPEGTEATILPVPSGLPSVTGTNYVGAVSDDGAHFYVTINGLLYHIIADSPGNLSTSSVVEGATLTKPGVGAMEQVLVSADGTALLIMDGAATVYRYVLSTPFTLSSAGAPVSVTLDSEQTYFGMSYEPADGLLLLHRRWDGSIEVVQSSQSLDFDTAAYAQRTLVLSVTQPTPDIFVSALPPARPKQNQLWLDIS